MGFAMSRPFLVGQKSKHPDARVVPGWCISSGPRHGGKQKVLAAALCALRGNKSRGKRKGADGKAGGRPWNRTRHGSPRRSYSPLPHLAARRPLFERLREPRFSVKRIARFAGAFAAKGASSSIAGVGLICSKGCMRRCSRMRAARSGACFVPRGRLRPGLADDPRCCGTRHALPEQALRVLQPGALRERQRAPKVHLWHNGLQARS